MGITILLIGSGWAFIKPYLSPNHKKILMVVLPLQILDNIAMAVVEDMGEGTATFHTWYSVFKIVDLVCLGMVLIPIVGSIWHLREASNDSDKGKLVRAKLKLFRQFYLMVIAYVYITRIVVDLLERTMPFQLFWVGALVYECVTVALFLTVGVKFSPEPDTPYLRVPQNDDDDDDAAETIQMRQLGRDD